MANGIIGTHPSHGYQVAHKLDTTGEVLTRNDSGKVFFCEQNSDAEVVIYLPKMSTEIAGWHGRFIISVDSTNAFKIQENASDNNIVVYVEGTVAVTAADNVAQGAATSGVSGANFGNNSPVGSMLDVHSDGTSWYFMIQTHDSSDVSTVA